MARKAILKRVKFTATGKLLHRHAGQNHFNAKQSRKSQRRQKSFSQFSNTINKNVKVHLQ